MGQSPLDGFFTWPTLLFAIVIYGVTRFIRATAENYFPKLRGHRIWEDVFLSCLPVALGAGLAILVKAYPLPPAFATGNQLRAFFGASIGGASGLLYKVFKAMVKKQWGVDLSAFPPPLRGTEVAVVVMPPQGPPPAIEDIPTSVPVTMGPKDAP
jgi:hypothetical protein